LFETQTALNRMDEVERCQDRSGFPLDRQPPLNNMDGVGDNLKSHQPVGFDAKKLIAQFTTLLHVNQRVCLPGELFIGLTTKIFLNPGGSVTHLVIRTAHLLGYHKLVPIALISDVTPSRVLLSIDREEFKKLPKYHSDRFILNEVDHLLWNDATLKNTDFGQIDVRVKNAVITMNGHVINSMNETRAVNAVKNIPGVVDVKSFLIPDDKLTLEISQVLGKIEQVEGCKFFTRVENGQAVLHGEVNNSSLRDQAEQSVAQIPWVRGVINEITIQGMDLEPEDRRFFQPEIGKVVTFEDGVSVEVQKVIINPNNRRVVAMVLRGKLSDLHAVDQKGLLQNGTGGESIIVLPTNFILFMNNDAGSLRINSYETNKYEVYDPSRYFPPAKDWLPPYPYCSQEVLFLAE
jgi:osmotically-inducible protein OsmY